MPPRTVRLSAGDVINIAIPEGNEFNGNYVIGPDGRINLPFIPPLKASGYTDTQLQSRIKDALIKGDLFSETFLRVAVRVVRYSSIQVRVRGAVFSPGLHSLNEPSGDQAEAAVAAEAVKTFGDTTMKRRVTAALRVAAGVRPDADLSQVELVRKGRSYLLDLRGVITGEELDDAVLENGDELRIPSRNLTCPN